MVLEFRDPTVGLSGLLQDIIQEVKQTQSESRHTKNLMTNFRAEVFGRSGLSDKLRQIEMTVTSLARSLESERAKRQRVAVVVLKQRSSAAFLGRYFYALRSCGYLRKQRRKQVEALERGAVKATVSASFTRWRRYLRVAARATRARRLASSLSARLDRELVRARFSRWVAHRLAAGARRRARERLQIAAIDDLSALADYRLAAKHFALLHRHRRTSRALRAFSDRITRFSLSRSWKKLADYRTTGHWRKKREHIALGMRRAAVTGLASVYFGRWRAFREASARLLRARDHLLFMWRLAERSVALRYLKTWTAFRVSCAQRREAHTVLMRCALVEEEVSAKQPAVEDLTRKMANLAALVECLQRDKISRRELGTLAHTAAGPPQPGASQSTPASPVGTHASAPFSLASDAALEAIPVSHYSRRTPVHRPHSFDAGNQQPRRPGPRDPFPFDYPSKSLRGQASDTQAPVDPMAAKAQTAHQQRRRSSLQDASPICSLGGGPVPVGSAPDTARPALAEIRCNQRSIPADTAGHPLPRKKTKDVRPFGLAEPPPCNSGRLSRAGAGDDDQWAAHYTELQKLKSYPDAKSPLYAESS
ncbi:hypothetical protein DIPPA_34267 [Diplonema papillatum]|nr:hypothetical protein DIPPA_34267 [Diplonema papillatum]